MIYLVYYIKTIIIVNVNKSLNKNQTIKINKNQTINLDKNLNKNLNKDIYVEI
jgi:hypothetical protein